MRRSHRPPFTTAPVADSQRSSTRCYSQLALARIAKGDGSILCEPRILNAMDDLHDLVLAMLGVAVAAVMLVAGELYLVTRPNPPEIYSEPPAVVTSSAEQQPR